MEMQYCIECELATYKHENSWHLNWEGMVDGKEPTRCFGPFTSSPPPEELPFWSWKLQVPSPDELAEMDAVVSELLTEFELV